MKKILIVIDDERRELEVDYFDLSISSGIGDGYDAIFAVETRKDMVLAEPGVGSISHPTKDSVMASSIPKTLTFQEIGLEDDLRMQRNIQGLNVALTIADALITEKVTYNVGGQSIHVPGILHTAVTALVLWEKEKSQGQTFCVTSGPSLLFTNAEQTQFCIVETIAIQTGVVVRAEDISKEGAM